MKSPVERMQRHLVDVYGDAETTSLLPRIAERLDAFRQRNPGLSMTDNRPADRLSEGDVILITYGDQIQEPGKAPLQTLDEVLTAWTSEFLSGVHILPFYPYSSDDGFSVIDYRKSILPWATGPTSCAWAAVSPHVRCRDQSHLQESEWFPHYLSR